VTNLVLPLAALGFFIVILVFAHGLCLTARAGDLPPRNPWDESDPEVADELRPSKRASIESLDGVVPPPVAVRDSAEVTFSLKRAGTAWPHPPPGPRCGHATNPLIC
jgi:hypothetical protein